MWLIIGYGNRLRGDDAAGAILAEQLARQLRSDQAQVLALHQLTPELVEELIRPEIDKVLFIDVERGQQRLRLVPLDPAAAQEQSCSHQQAPELLLFAARQLYRRKIPGWLLTIPGHDFSHMEGLSPATDAPMKEALELIRNLLKQKG